MAVCKLNPFLSSTSLFTEQRRSDCGRQMVANGKYRTQPTTLQTMGINDTKCCSSKMFSWFRIDANYFKAIHNKRIYYTTTHSNALHWKMCNFFRLVFRRNLSQNFANQTVRNGNDKRRCSMLLSQLFAFIQMLAHSFPLFSFDCCVCLCVFDVCKLRFFPQSFPFLSLIPFDYFPHS